MRKCLNKRGIWFPQHLHNIVGYRWVFTLKYLPDGTIDMYKVRLLAKEFNQTYGVDYSENFSPVIKPTTIRLVLDVATSQSWPSQQLDVNNAFLQGTLTEKVYMSQPPGLVDISHPHHVCRLKKPIYGLKQASRVSYMALEDHLL